MPEVQGYDPEMVKQEGVGEPFTNAKGGKRKRGRSKSPRKKSGGKKRKSRSGKRKSLNKGKKRGGGCGYEMDGGKKKKKKSGKKRKLNAYMKFMQDYRKKHPKPTSKKEAQKLVKEGAAAYRKMRNGK